MYKLERIWEQERIEKMNQEAFDEEFNSIFEEEDSDWETSTESDEEEDSDWETFEEETEVESVPEPEPVFQKLNLFESFDENKYYSDFMLGEIEQLQRNYQKAMDLGVGFDWYVNNNMFYDFQYEKTVWIEDDIFPHQKNLFVSNYNGGITKRNSTRVPPKGDTSFVFVLNIEVF
jgi:hypothetical protein